MSAKSSTSSGPGDQRGDDEQPTAPSSGSGLSRAKSMKRPSQATGGVKATARSQQIQFRTATVLTAGCGYLQYKGPPMVTGIGRQDESDRSHVDGRLVIWNQKLQ